MNNLKNGNGRKATTIKHIYNEHHIFKQSII